MGNRYMSPYSRTLHIIPLVYPVWRDSENICKYGYLIDKNSFDNTKHPPAT